MLGALGCAPGCGQDRVAGMGAKVRWRAERGAWFVYFERAGRRWNKRYGATEADRVDAEAAAAAFNLEGDEIKARRESLYPGSAAPFSVVAAAWWDAKAASMPASSIDSKRCVVHTRLIPFLGAQDVRRIDDDRIRECAVHQADQGHARETVETTGAILDQILRWAIGKGFADRCPALTGFGGDGVVRIFRRVAAAKCPPSSRIEAWTREEVRILIDCARERGEWMADPLLFLALTGCRRGEALALEWPDVDLERGRARIRQSLSRGQIKTTKAGRGRSVELAPELIAMLQRRALKEREGRVFRGQRGRPWTDRGFNTAWQRVRVEGVKRGVRKLKLHCFRHSWASWALAAGHDPAWCAAQLGHSLQIFFKRYAHLIEGPRRSLDFLSLSLGGAAPRPAPSESAQTAAPADGPAEQAAAPGLARLH
jgi:integrase